MSLAPGPVAELGLDAAPEPYVVRHVYRALLDGRCQPMSDREMGLANAAAELRLLAMHFEMKGADFNDPLVQSLMVMGAERFRVGFSGYNTRTICYENSEFNEPWVLTAGFLRRPHAREAPPTAVPGDRVRFYRVTREEALATTPGSTVRHIFDHHAPMFRLSATQRRLLWLSLFDDHDDTLMRRLGVSTHGLKNPGAASTSASRTSNPTSLATRQVTKTANAAPKNAARCSPTCASGPKNCGPGSWPDRV